MNKNYVETFWSNSSYADLQYKINKYCEKYNYNPISISVTDSANFHVAFVVVEEGDSK